MRHGPANHPTTSATEVRLLPENTRDVSTGIDAEGEAGARLAAARAADALWRQQRKEHFVRRDGQVRRWGERLDRLVRISAMGMVALIGVGTLVVLSLAFFGPAGAARRSLSQWSEWLGQVQNVGFGLMLAGFAFDQLWKYWRRCGEQEGIELDEPSG